MKIAFALLFLAQWISLLARTSAAQEPPSLLAKPTETPAPATVETANWEELFARAESAAQQWEAKAKELEKQATAELAEMDPETRAVIKQGQTTPLPPAPKSRPAAGDFRTRFYAADIRGKAWRARALVLEVRIRDWQPKLAEARARRAAFSASGIASSSSPGSESNIAGSGGSVSVRGYTRSNGTSVAPYSRNSPGTSSNGGRGR